MNQMSVEQQKQRSRVRTGSMVSGGLVVIVVASAAFFATEGMDLLWRGLIVVCAAGVLGYLAYRTGYSVGVAKSRCPKCGTPFGIREVDRHERVIGTQEHSETEELVPASETTPGVNRVTTWVEEKVEVTAVDECFHCHDRGERVWTMTRDKDKAEREGPA